MWLLQVQGEDDPPGQPGSHYLRPGTQLTFGRRGPFFKLTDKTVSKSHFSISVGGCGPQDAAVLDHIPTLVFTNEHKVPVTCNRADEYVNELKPGEPFEVKSGDRFKLSKRNDTEVTFIWHRVVVAWTGKTTEVVDKLAPLGVKCIKNPDPFVATHFVTAATIEKWSAPNTGALANASHFCTTKFVSLLSEASTRPPIPTDDDGKESEHWEGSALEKDFFGSWPDEGGCRPVSKLESDGKAVRVDLAPDQRRRSLFEGLTFYAVGNDGEASVSFAQKLIESTLGRFVLHDPETSPFTSSSQVTDAIAAIKNEADLRYYNALGRKGIAHPPEAKNSGLVLITLGPGWANDVVEAGREDMYREGAQSLGLIWVDGECARTALVDCEVVKSCFIPGRIEGPMPRPPTQTSQVAGTYGSSLAGGSHPALSPMDEDAPMAGPLSGVSGQVASGSGSRSESSSSSRIGSRSASIAREPAKEMQVDEDQVEAPAAPPPPTMSKLPKRRARTARPVIDLDVEFGLDDPEPARPAADRSASTSMMLDEPVMSVPSTSTTRLTRRAGTQRADPWEDDRYETTGNSTVDPSYTVDSQERIKRLADSIRSHHNSGSNSQDDPASQGGGDEAPPSAQGRHGDGGRDTQTGGDFVEESLRRKRVKLEKEKEDKEFKEKKEREAEETKKAEELKRRKANLSIIGDEEDDTHMGGAGQGDDDEEEEIIPSTNNKASSSKLKPTTSAAAMPPPTSTSSSNKKRPLSPSSTQAAAYLQAPSKRKKKGEELDPLDVEFNKLKLAKKQAAAGTGAGTKEGEGDMGDGVTCKMVVVEVPLFRKPREQQRDVVDGSVPNFKKFKRQKVIRSAAIALVMPSQVDLGLGSSHWSRSAQSREDEEESPFPTLTKFNNRSGSSFPTLNASASGSRSSLSHSNVPLATATGGVKRKRLLQAVSEDEEEEEEPPVKKGWKGKAVAVGKGKKASASSSKAPKGSQAIIISSSDEEGDGSAALASQSQRTASGRRPTTQTLSDEDEIDGGLIAASGSSRAGSSRRAVVPPPATGSSRRKMLIQDESDSDGEGGMGLWGTRASANGSTRSSRRR